MCQKQHEGEMRTEDMSLIDGHFASPRNLFLTVRLTSLQRKKKKREKEGKLLLDGHTDLKTLMYSTSVLRWTFD